MRKELADKREAKFDRTYKLPAGWWKHDASRLNKYPWAPLAVLRDERGRRRARRNSISYRRRTGQNPTTREPSRRSLIQIVWDEALAQARRVQRATYEQNRVPFSKRLELEEEAGELVECFAGLSPPEPTLPSKGLDVTWTEPWAGDW